MAVCKRVVVMVIILVAITMVTGIKSYREERNTDQQEKDPHYKGDEGKEDEEDTEEDEPILTLRRYYEHIQDEFIYGHCLVKPNEMEDGSDVEIRGTIDFKQSLYGGSTEMHMQLWGFNTTDSVTLHGLHVHEFGDLSMGCQSAGGHYNPFDVVHGAPSDSPQYRHFGDLGNVEEDKSGEVTLRMEDLLVSLLGPFSILGRGVVIHAGTDDLGRGEDEESLRTGNAGSRLACCTIGLSDGAAWRPTREQLEEQHREIQEELEEQQRQLEQEQQRQLEQDQQYRQMEKDQQGDILQQHQQQEQKQNDDTNGRNDLKYKHQMGKSKTNIKVDN